MLTENLFKLIELNDWRNVQSEILEWIANSQPTIYDVEQAEIIQKYSHYGTTQPKVLDAIKTFILMQDEYSGERNNIPVLILSVVLPILILILILILKHIQ